MNISRAIIDELEHNTTTHRIKIKCFKIVLQLRDRPMGNPEVALPSGSMALHDHYDQFQFNKVQVYCHGLSFENCW